MITLDSSKTVSKRPAPNPNFLFGRGVGFSLSGCCPTCSKSWRLGSQRGLCRSTRETRLRKEVEGKQFEGKQLEDNKFESRKRRPTFTAHFWPGDLDFEMRTSQGNAAVKELAPDKSNNTFTKFELVRVEALVQQHAFER